MDQLSTLGIYSSLVDKIWPGLYRFFLSSSKFWTKNLMDLNVPTPFVGGR